VTLVIERIVAVELVKILSFFTSSHRRGPMTSTSLPATGGSSSDTSSPPLTQPMLVIHTDRHEGA
jgi:hypothetical protein